MKIDDLFDKKLLDEMVTEGFIRVQQHPLVPLAIANYTPKTQYSREWNDVTRQCRGLIWNLTSGEVVARPFPKFFNLGELSDDEIPAEPFKAFEKMDGSLGILYRDGDGWAIATRGSFLSDQAKWATAWLRRWLVMPPDAPSPSYWEPRDGWTYLFEIIYPANRIVVDYGGREGLVLLDVIDNETGESRLDQALSQRPWPWFGWVVQEYSGFDGLEALLSAPQPDNAEGYVIHFAGGMRAKVKHDEYIRLHRIVTGVSTKTVWEYLSQGRTFDELLERVPDEFNEWLQTTAAGLVGAYQGIEDASKHDFDYYLSKASWDVGGSDGGVGVTPLYRKTFALSIKDHEYKDILFKMLDNKDYAEAIWKRLRPEYEKPFMAISEDIA